MNWYLIYTKPRHELKLSERLRDMGFSVYCPTIRTVRQWSDRKKRVEEPLFKSYVFIKMQEKQRETIVWTPGFSRFIFWQGKPVIVREEEIQATRDFLADVEHDSIKLEIFKPGVNVKVTSGPFKSQIGKILRVEKKKAILQLDTLGTIVSAQIALTKLSL